MIPNPDLKDTPLFDVQYLINGIHDRDIVTMQDTNKKFIFITHPLHCRKNAIVITQVIFVSCMKC